MADAPPPYAESSSASEKGRRPVWLATYADEVTIYRSHHVASAALKIQEAVEARARYGISKRTLLLLPKDQINASKKLEFVELEDTKYTVIELCGEADSVEFWSQVQTTQELQSRLRSDLNGGRTGGSSLVKVDVQPMELHLRTESDFGLLETVLVACIIVNLDM
ncbi:hypothetical protein AAFC00_001111 [Neodothiora populina]|uniref:Uncharacterized protein n=1 Tax=Neodothiora populina TaxID=2781224 RepID=A0ABR3PMV7_9PEZI